ncbi:hypothetical protein GCM10023166_18270 [Paeniglutamicibacter cryotolerans]
MPWHVISVALRQCLFPHYLLGSATSPSRMLAWGTHDAKSGIMGALTLALLGLMPALRDKAIAQADVEAWMTRPVRRADGRSRSPRMTGSLRRPHGVCAKETIPRWTAGPTTTRIIVKPAR